MTKGYPASALILGLQTTALATARALADMNVPVYAASFRPATAERRSNTFKFIDATTVPINSDDIADWLYHYAAKSSEQPVIFPTSDTTALALAKHRDELSTVCRITDTAYEQLKLIVSKESLYAWAGQSGINVPPAIVEPNIDELEIWCRENRGPYLVKPFYQNVPGCKVIAKNLVFESPQSLLAFAEKDGTEYLIIQRQIVGGDGYVFDCYGYCNRNFDLITQATHTRLRQYPRHFGTTSYGEIPARPRDFPESRILDLTRELLEGFEYNGIFGIEWIEDRESKELYLIDFNARPFLSIGHLSDCGLNLPFIAYRDLAGEPVNDVPLRPRLSHKYWIYFVNDWEALPDRLRAKEITLMQWVVSLLKARSFSTWRWTDMGPGIHFLIRWFRSLFASKVDSSD
jgi:predicted ATP-grasp superfamily ATP-dependent carboligase